MDRTKSVVCALDIGTSAVRGALVAEDGQVLASARHHRMSSEGMSKFDPTKLWLVLTNLLRGLITQSASPISAVVIAGHVGTVLVDEAGAPIGSGFGWGDTSGVRELRSRGAISGSELRMVGRPQVCAGALPQLNHFAERYPEGFCRIRWVLTPKDFVLHRLGAEGVTDRTSAAYSLVLDINSVRWDMHLVAVSGLTAEQFPLIYQATDTVGCVSRSAAQSTGLPEGTPLLAGGPDGSVGAVAALGTSMDAVADVAGTTDVLTLIRDHAESEPGPALTNPYLIHGLWSRGGSTGMTSGAVAHWARLFGYGGVGGVPLSVQRQVDRIPPGCDGLALVPTISGSRFPDWVDTERGALWGLTSRHEAAHFLRAAQEASAFVVRRGVEALAVNEDVPVMLAGGSSRSASVSQLRANVLGRVVRACNDPDATLLGAAIIGHVGSGTYGSLAEGHRAMAAGNMAFYPDSAKTTVYDGLYESWLDRRQRIHPSCPQPV